MIQILDVQLLWLQRKDTFHIIVGHERIVDQVGRVEAETGRLEEHAVVLGPLQDHVLVQRVVQLDRAVDLEDFVVVRLCNLHVFHVRLERVNAHLVSYRIILLLHLLFLV